MRLMLGYIDGNFPSMLGGWAPPGFAPDHNEDLKFGILKDIKKIEGKFDITFDQLIRNEPCS
jgi:hypothetical protein